MTDSEIVVSLRSLLCADDKPQQITPLDLLQITRLLLQHADEKDVALSQDTIAEQLCTSADTIARSQERLAEIGWLIVRKGGYRGRTNSCTVALDHLPVAELSKTVVSEQARSLAAQYGQFLRVENRKKFMRGWLQQWSFTIQKLIDRTEGGAARVAEIINFAFNSPLYMGRAKKGPAELRRVWRKLESDSPKANPVVIQ